MTRLIQFFATSVFAFVVGSGYARATTIEECTKLLSSAAEKVKTSCGSTEFKISCDPGVNTSDIKQIDSLAQGCKDAAAAVAQECSNSTFKASFAKVGLTSFYCVVRSKPKISAGGTNLNVNYTKDQKGVGDTVIKAIENLAK